MKPRLAQKLKLAYVAEPVQAIDEAGIFAGGDAPAVVLVVVDKFHPALIIVPPRDFVFGGPVIPIRAVVRPAGSKEFPKVRHGVVLMPFRAPRAHEITAGFINRKSWIDGEVELDQLVTHAVPFCAAG